MLMKMLNYSWQNFDRDVKKLANKIKKDPVDYDCIVAINRGGLPLASKLSYLLDIRQIYTLGYLSYEGQIQKELKQTKRINSELKNKTILLVDDLVDSGQTLLTARVDLERKINRVITVVLHLKDRAVATPHYYIKKINQWVNYPWEK